MSKRSRHIRTMLRRGPTEAGYAFFRARRRRRNVADEEPELRAADLDLEDLEANAEVLRAYAALDVLEVRSVQWFLPWFHLTTGGGVHTALRLAAHLAERHGVAQRFCIYDREDSAGARDIAAKAAAAFPALGGGVVRARGGAAARRRRCDRDDLGERVLPRPLPLGTGQVLPRPGLGARLPSGRLGLGDAR